MATDPANVAISPFLFFFAASFFHRRSRRPNDHRARALAAPLAAAARTTRRKLSVLLPIKLLAACFLPRPVNKRSRRLWRAALTTGTGYGNFVNTTDRWGKLLLRGGVYIYRRMGQAGVATYIREIDWRVCITRSSSTSSRLVGEAAKKLFPGGKF